MLYFRDEFKVPRFSSQQIMGQIPETVTKIIAMNTPLRVSKGYGSQVKYAVLMPLFYFVFCFSLLCSS